MLEIFIDDWYYTLFLFFNRVDKHTIHAHETRDGGVNTRETQQTYTEFESCILTKLVSLENIQCQMRAIEEERLSVAKQRLQIEKERLEIEKENRSALLKMHRPW